MTDDVEQLDAVEEALRELDSAEQAGLFRRTRVDASKLVAGASHAGRTGARRLVLRLLPVAAAVAMAAGVWSWQFMRETDGSSRPRIVAVNSLASAGFHACEGGFLGCFSGPRDGIQPACVIHDYDLDGDVDLADYRAYQLAYVTPGQTR